MTSPSKIHGLIHSSFFQFNSRRVNLDSPVLLSAGRTPHALNLDEFSKTILLGGNLEEKLIDPGSLYDAPTSKDQVVIPEWPTRSPVLSFRKIRNNSATFPTRGDLELDQNRGLVLHFFANHELLALELMALALLKFPSAPRSFRLGIAATMREEQSHLRLYLKRMEELGVEFGDAPLNNYFWNCMAKMQSPLDFITSMSLTFEQGNLDFSRLYQTLFHRLGDHKSSAIMEQVYLDEIGHVKHGLKWFHEFRNSRCPEKSEWEAYRYLLMPNLSPARAKASRFFTEARVAAGFTQDYIEELQNFRASKGRPPSIWIFNPDFEDGLAKRPKQPLMEMLRADLAPVFSLLANAGDYMLGAPMVPTAKTHLDTIKKLGLCQASYIELKDLQENPKFEKLSSFEPWGWNHETFSIARSFSERLTSANRPSRDWLRSQEFEAVPIANLNSKIWASQKLSEFTAQLSFENSTFLGSENLSSKHCQSEEDLSLGLKYFLDCGFEECLIKDIFGASGRGQKRVSCKQKLSQKTATWVRKTLKKGDNILLEGYLDNVANFSSLVRIDSTSHAKLLGLCRFLTAPNRSYLGHCLGSKQLGLSGEIIRALNHRNGEQKTIWDIIQNAALFVANQLSKAGYRGVAGIDSLVYRSRLGTYHVKPIVEVNCRHTMGHCALKLEQMLGTKTSGLFLVKPQKSFFKSEHALENYFKIDQFQNKNPDLVLNEKGKIAQGFAFLNDPDQAQFFLAGLFVRSHEITTH